MITLKDTREGGSIGESFGLSTERSEELDFLIRIKAATLLEQRVKGNLGFILTQYSLFLAKSEEELLYTALTAGLEMGKVIANPSYRDMLIQQMKEKNVPEV